jgi:hypothetical protein
VVRLAAMADRSVSPLEISDDMQKSHGLAPLGDANGKVKEEMLGRNGAKVYGVQPAAHASSAMAMYVRRM